MFRWRELQTLVAEWGWWKTVTLQTHWRKVEQAGVGLVWLLAAVDVGQDCGEV